MLFRIIAGLKRRFWLMRYKSIGFACLGKNTVLDNDISFSGAKYISIGDDCFIGADSTIQCFDRYGSAVYSPYISIGNHVTITKRATIYCAEKVEIGDETLIGSDVLITDENHGIDPGNTYRDNPLITKPVIIGTNVWIGDKVVILPGVDIGDHAIIGAGSVVTKSVPSYTVCVGNPAGVIKTWNFESQAWERVK